MWKCGYLHSSNERRKHSQSMTTFHIWLLTSNDDDDASTPQLHTLGKQFTFGFGTPTTHACIKLLPNIDSGEKWTFSKDFALNFFLAVPFYISPTVRSLILRSRSRHTSIHLLALGITISYLHIMATYLFAKRNKIVRPSIFYICFFHRLAILSSIPFSPAHKLQWIAHSIWMVGSGGDGNGDGGRYKVKSYNFYTWRTKVCRRHRSRRHFRTIPHFARTLHTKAISIQTALSSSELTCSLHFHFNQNALYLS